MEKASSPRSPPGRQPRSPVYRPPPVTTKRSKSSIVFVKPGSAKSPVSPPPDRGPEPERERERDRTHHSSDPSLEQRLTRLEQEMKQLSIERALPLPVEDPKRPRMDQMESEIKGLFRQIELLRNQMLNSFFDHTFSLCVHEHIKNLHVEIEESVLFAHYMNHVGDALEEFSHGGRDIGAMHLFCQEYIKTRIRVDMARLQKLNPKKPELKTPTVE